MIGQDFDGDGDLPAVSQARPASTIDVSKRETVRHRAVFNLYRKAMSGPKSWLGDGAVDALGV